MCTFRIQATVFEKITKQTHHVVSLSRRPHVHIRLQRCDLMRRLALRLIYTRIPCDVVKPLLSNRRPGFPRRAGPVQPLTDCLEGKESTSSWSTPRAVIKDVFMVWIDDYEKNLPLRCKKCQDESQVWTLLRMFLWKVYYFTILLHFFIWQFKLIQIY